MGDTARQQEAKRRLDAATRGLSQQTTAAAASGRFPWRTGVVTSTSPLQVTYPGESPIDVGRLAHYTPTLSDVVLVLTESPVATIIGKFA